MTLSRRALLAALPATILLGAGCDPKAMLAEIEEASKKADEMGAELEKRVGGEPNVGWNKHNGRVTVRIDFRGTLKDEAEAVKAAEELAKKYFPDAHRVLTMRCTLEQPGNVNRCRQL